MTPSEYFHELVEPMIIAEFESNPTSKRHAYAACIFAFHFADAVATSSKGKLEPGDVANKLGELTRAFPLVWDIAILSKHLELNPKYKRNKGRPLPKIADTHIGPSAAFTDGTMFDDGTSFDDAVDVVRTKDGTGQYVDVLWCVREVRRAIETYLPTL
jgi:hypothetical protein